MRFVNEEDSVQAKKRVKSLVLLYCAISVLFVAATLLLLFLSPDTYWVFMALDILLTAAFGVYSVYFFTVSLFLARKKYAWIERILSARTETQYAVFQAEEGIKTVDGVEFHAYVFLVKGDEREYKTFDSFAFEEGKRYRIESGAGVVIESEEANE